MKKNPDENDDQVDSQVDEEVREYAESLPGYREFLEEQRGDSLNYGDM